MKYATFEEFEKQVMNILLHWENAHLSILRKQYTSAQVESREFTGHGFFTHFTVPDSVERIQNPENAEFWDIKCLIDGIDAGFLVFIRDGKLSMLEGYTYGDDPWIENPKEFTLAYDNKSYRDLGQLSNFKSRA